MHRLDGQMCAESPCSLICAESYYTFMWASQTILVRKVITLSCGQFNQFDETRERKAESGNSRTAVGFTMTEHSVVRINQPDRTVLMGRRCGKLLYSHLGNSISSHRLDGERRPENGKLRAETQEPQWG